ncbi:MAG TPA: zinc ribbon domain-containing protein [Candidatus Saccharimonadales bacterium]|nr:zinc ribbon domain-containing protein [Candidatus Saccharimonadales bacterium]
MDINPICPNCSLQVLPAFYFCPNCGKNLRPKPLSISVGKQIGIYLVSVLLPPLGLWPAVKYLRQDDQKAKNVGIVAIVLTIAATVVTIYIAIGLGNQMKAILNAQLGGSSIELNNPLQQAPDANSLSQ